MSTLVATIKAYRRKGGAAVTITREGRPPRRYCVSLKRYHALRRWTLAGPFEEVSGAWLRGSMTAYLHVTPAGREVTRHTTV